MNQSETWRDKINVPLLRKGVEWVEEQAALPMETRQWMQEKWVTSEEDRVESDIGVVGCGTAYCLAGWIAMQKHPELADKAYARVNGVTLRSSEVATEELGLPSSLYAPEQYEGLAHNLFDANNTAVDIRRIAEELAGEKL